MNKEEFYPIYVEWSEYYNFPSRRIEEIDTIVGCYNGNALTYTCFFWGTNSTFCVVGFPFANPYLPKERKLGCLTALFEGIGKMAKEAGYSLMWTTSGTPPVESALIESGFQPGDTKVDQYIKVL